MRHKPQPRTRPAVPFWSPDYGASAPGSDANDTEAAEREDRGAAARPATDEGAARSGGRAGAADGATKDTLPARVHAFDPESTGRERIGGPRWRAELVVVAVGLVFLVAAALKPWVGSAATPAGDVQTGAVAGATDGPAATPSEDVTARPLDLPYGWAWDRHRPPPMQGPMDQGPPSATPTVPTNRHGGAGPVFTPAPPQP